MFKEGAGKKSAEWWTRGTWENCTHTWGLWKGCGHFQRRLQESRTVKLCCRWRLPGPPAPRVGLCAVAEVTCRREAPAGRVIRSPVIASSRPP